MWVVCRAMRDVARDRRLIWYANPTGTMGRKKDEYGYYTGEKNEVYTEPKSIRISVTGTSGYEAFGVTGINNDYDRFMTTAKSDCPILQNAHVWVGVEPKQPYNYVVVKRSETIGGVQYAMQEVSRS